MGPPSRDTAPHGVSPCRQPRGCPAPRRPVHRPSNSRGRLPRSGSMPVRRSAGCVPPGWSVRTWRPLIWLTLFCPAAQLADCFARLRSVSGCRQSRRSGDAAQRLFYWRSALSAGFERPSAGTCCRRGAGYEIAAIGSANQKVRAVDRARCRGRPASIRPRSVPYFRV